MAKPPAKKNSPNINPATQENGEIVPRQNVEILRKSLGIDVSAENPDELRAMIGSIERSTSTSPYTSAEMLKEYQDLGFPGLVDKVIETIDAENAHRQHLERYTVEQEQNRLNKSQDGARILAVIGVSGALLAGYFGVSPTICSVVAAVSVGGPPVASIVLRFVDRSK